MCAYLESGSFLRSVIAHRAAGRLAWAGEIPPWCSAGGCSVLVQASPLQQDTACFPSRSTLGTVSLCRLWLPDLTSLSLSVNETHEIGPLSDISVANRSTLSWRLSGLSASTKYKFYVKACTAKGCGNPVTEEGLTMAQGSKLIGNMFSCEEALTITEKKIILRIFQA